MIRFGSMLAILAIVSGSASNSNAGLSISIGSLNLAPGGSGLVDVTISGNPAAQDLAIASFTFQITTGGPTSLEFDNPQPDSQLTNPNYVFFGNSFALINAIPVGTVSTTNTPNDTFSGGDRTNILGDVSVPTTGKLLVQLKVTAATALPPVIGDTFTIELVDTSKFQTSELKSILVDSSAGTVTIVSPVPEPASWIVLLGLSTLLGCLYRQPRRSISER